MTTKITLDRALREAASLITIESAGRQQWIVVEPIILQDGQPSRTSTYPSKYWEARQIRSCAVAIHALRLMGYGEDDPKLLRAAVYSSRETSTRAIVREYIRSKL